LFVEGSHENFEELEKYETEEWCGGMTRKISGNLRQLMRGNVFEIAGKKVFAFGGGKSDDTNDELKMKNTDDGRTSTYIRTDSFEGMQPVQNTSTPDELIGSWENKNIGKSYKFAQNGKATITVYGKSYEGVYLTDGTTVMIQYSASGKKNTEKYTFAVTKSNLALTDSDGSTFNFSRMGTEVAPSADSSALLGVWRDSANLSGYEFKAGEVVSVTFVNIEIPVIDVPINGTFTGGYEVENGVLSLTYYIYGKKISNSYNFEVSGNTLKLKDTETGKVSTYVKQ
jgi:hypothetical protein